MKRTLLLVLLALIGVFALPAAEQHVVAASELEQTLQAAAETRLQNEADLQRLLSNEQVRQAAEAAGIDTDQVQAAVARLDDETLADLSARARALEHDVSGGVIGGILIVLILILLLAVLISVYVID